MSGVGIHAATQDGACAAQASEALHVSTSDAVGAASRLILDESSDSDCFMEAVRKSERAESLAGVESLGRGSSDALGIEQPAGIQAGALQSLDVDSDSEIWLVQAARNAESASSHVPMPSRLATASPAGHATLQHEELPPTIPAMPAADYVDDPMGEVEHWFKVVVNMLPQVVQDIAFWQSMPMFTQYIMSKTFSEIVDDCMTSIRASRGLDISIEDASKLQRCLGSVTLLPLAVMATYLHRGCGLPDIFAFDLYQACLASCQHIELAMACYADRSSKFNCRARWWACPPGDPNAGKSPTCSLIGGWFRQLVTGSRHLFHPVDHVVGVGNNGKIQERMRKLTGTVLLVGPEAKPVLDPDFPSRGKVDVGRYIDWTRWLECANGGAFEWGTAAEERATSKSKARRHRSDTEACGGDHPASAAVEPFHARLRAAIDRLAADSSATSPEVLAELNSLQAESTRMPLLCASTGEADLQRLSFEKPMLIFANFNSSAWSQIGGCQSRRGTSSASVHGPL